MALLVLAVWPIVAVAATTYCGEAGYLNELRYRTICFEDSTQCQPVKFAQRSGEVQSALLLIFMTQLPSGEVSRARFYPELRQDLINYRKAILAETLNRAQFYVEGRGFNPTLGQQVSDMEHVILERLRIPASTNDEAHPVRAAAKGFLMAYQRAFVSAVRRDNFATQQFWRTMLSQKRQKFRFERRALALSARGGWGANVRAQAIFALPGILEPEQIKRLDVRRLYCFEKDFSDYDAMPRFMKTLIGLNRDCRYFADAAALTEMFHEQRLDDLIQPQVCRVLAEHMNDLRFQQSHLKLE